MSHKILFFIAGLGLFWSGYGILRYGKEFKYGYTVPHDFGYIVIAFGVLISIYGVLFKAKKSEDDDAFICTACGRAWKRKDAPGGSCPDCGGELDDVEGFFDRHPEMKD